MRGTQRHLPQGPVVVGVGSLPHTDPDDAVEFVRRYSPIVPYWPQLPQRDPREGMVAQVLAGAPSVIDVTRMAPRDGLRESDLERVEGWLLDSDPDFHPKSAAGLIPLLRAIDAGRFPLARAVKGQLAGPMTVAAVIAPRLSAQNHDRLLVAIAAHLAKLARRLIRLFPDPLERIVTIDEPVVSTELGAAGRAWRGIAAAIHDEGGLVGLHTCGDAPPWDELCLPEIDVLSFDADPRSWPAFFASSTATTWMQRGGRLLLGLAPTDRVLSIVECSDRVAAWSRRSLQIDAAAPWGVSPSCGLALRSVELAARVMESCEQLASTWRTS